MVYHCLYRLLMEKCIETVLKNTPSDKLPKAPIISQKDLKKILIDLPKPNTDLLLSGKTSSAITNPRDVVGSLLQQAKMTLNKKNCR